MSWPRLMSSSRAPSSSALVHLVVLFSVMWLTACPEGIDPSLVEERCTDGLDNNGDDLVDCEDPTCALFATCTGNEHCYNGVDDNGDGKIDCEEESCKALFICLQDIEDCSNGRDDDRDGKIDCQDSACANTSVCKPGAEACTGGIDEDKDGDIDCDDEDCKSVFVCLQSVEIPGNGVDDDGDGKIDCDDADIANTSSCLDGKEICDDSLDNDGDGQSDCDDADCAQTSFCLAPAEVCDNGLDDDNDGDIDCDDANCTGSSFCRDEICDDGVDNDGDGLVDCDDTEDCSPTLHVCLLTAEQCDNQSDDDGDGLIDCEDSDCVGHSACLLVEACDNQSDDDGDGLIDCLDPDCSGATLCQCPIDALGTPLDCANPLCTNVAYCQCETTRTDAGTIDCDAQSCQETYPDCNRNLLAEICGDFGIDNDDDGYTDCDDVDCSEQNGCPQLACAYTETYFERMNIPDCQQSACVQLEAECASNIPMEFCNGDGIDNDGDGDIDCEDSDCALEPLCQCPLIDGEPDCGDPRCTEEDVCVCQASVMDNPPWEPRPNCDLPACKNLYEGCRTGLPSEVCDGFGIDNDQNNATDCADPACNTTAECACPFDAQGVPLDCTLPSCQVLDYCQCAATANDDGLVDCNEPYCQSQYLDCRTGLPTEACGSFGIDNDGDGYTDCDDVDCSEQNGCPQLACAYTETYFERMNIPDCQQSACVQLEAECASNIPMEFCNGDGIDNDGDGDIDCEDSDCELEPLCQCPLDMQGVPLSCSDDRCIDHDYCQCEETRASNGGELDCDDASCKAAHLDCNINQPAEVCGAFGVDNDGDGYTDCDDMDCWGMGSCPTPSCPHDQVYYELTNVPDCTNIACQQTELACATGQSTEFCDGGNVDNDGDGDIDCHDSECDGMGICACPVDAQNVPLSCGDGRCSSHPYCLCLDQSTPFPNAVPGTTLADCTQTQCQSAAPECMEGLGTEACHGDGIDNDGDGLIDCEDPDCHDFANNNAYCTRALCGDPANSYLVVEVNTSMTEQFTVNSPLDYQAISNNLPGEPTLLRGDISFTSPGNAYNLPASNLRCVLPGTNSAGNVFVEDASLNGRAGFEKLAVVQRLTLVAQPAGQEFTGFVSLSQIIKDLEVIEPDYTTNDDMTFHFTGLTNLHRIGGHLSILPSEPNIDPNNGLFDFEGTRFSFASLTELVEVGLDFGNMPARDPYEYPPIYIPGSQGCRWAERDNSEIAFAPPKGEARGGFLLVDGFAGLEKLRRIGGDLCVTFEHASASTNFIGLGELEHIGGTFGVGSNLPNRYIFPSIPISFDGLSKLESVGQDFFVASGDGSADSVYLYTDYTGLSSLTTIGRHFATVLQNDFDDFTGLDSLVAIGGDMLLQSEFGGTSHSPSPFLTLSNLLSIGGNLQLDSTNTNKLDGLQNINALGGLVLANNQNLDDISQLSTIATLPNGDLYLVNNSSLTDYAALSQISAVSGTVASDTVEAFNKLNNLQTVGQNLMAFYMSGLLDFSSMNNLSSIGGLILVQCDDLVSLSGLPSMSIYTHDLVIDSIDQSTTDLSLLNTLTEVQGSVELRYNFQDANVLSSLVTIGGSLIIESASLTTLDGLNNLANIGHDLILSYNDQLTSIAALANLVAIPHDLSITSIPITSLDGLQNVTTVGHDLSLSSNFALTDISALLNVSSVSTDPAALFYVETNASLCPDRVTTLHNHWTALGFQGTSLLSNNTGSACP